MLKIKEMQPWTDEKYVQLFALMETKPCLWQKAHPYHSKREVTDGAVKTIAECLKCEPAEVLIRWRSMRQTFFKYLQKEHQMKSESEKRKSWRFMNYLRFLESEAPELGNKERFYPLNASGSTAPLYTEVNQERENLEYRLKRLRNDESPSQHNETMESERMPVKKEQDSHDYLALVWSEKLRNIQPMQRKIAEKLINDILFQADMGLLNMNSIHLLFQPPSSSVNSLNTPPPTSFVEPIILDSYPVKCEPDNEI